MAYVVENLKPLHIFKNDVFQYIYEECVDIKHGEVGFVRHSRNYTGYIITWCRELDNFLDEKVLSREIHFDLDSIYIYIIIYLFNNRTNY